MNELLFMIDPVPASRPRMTRTGHAYTAEPYRTFKDKLKTMMQTSWDNEMIESPVTVSIAVWCRRPKSTKLPHPRPDVDNYAKAVLDAMSGVVFTDDKNVVELYVTKQWTESTDEEGYIAVKVKSK